MSETLDKGLKRVVTGRCSGQPQHSHLTCTDARCASPGLGASTGHSPLAQRLRGVPTGRHPVSSGDCGQQLWYGSQLPLCSLLLCLSHLSPNCPTSLLPGLIPVSVDSRLMGLSRGHCLESSFPPPAPDPTVSPAHIRVSVCIPQEASSGLLPAQMKMVLSATCSPQCLSN